MQPIQHFLVSLLLLLMDLISKKPKLILSIDLELILVDMNISHDDTRTPIAF